MRNHFKTAFDRLTNAFFPNLCHGCHANLLREGEVFCTDCCAKLPFTDFHLHKDNKMTERMDGRLSENFHTAAALFTYSKGSRARGLIHSLKYSGHMSVGLTLGQELGKKLNDSELYDEVDVIVPVPLHDKKHQLRGFNQAKVFADGLAMHMNIGVATDYLIRNKHTKTQTKKSRLERVQNVANVFGLNHVEAIANKHILLVDDVFTTGSTMERCAEQLLSISGVKVSFATIACAVN